MKWVFYVVVFVYMFYRAVYGLKLKELNSLSIEPVKYDGDLYMPPYSQKTIACKYTNQNQKVEWLDPEGNPITRMSKERISTRKHTIPLKNGEYLYSLLLSFIDTKVEDTGVYTCKSGDLVDRVDFCVIDPADFGETSTEILVEIGKPFTLSCSARGQPEPNIIWFRNGEIIEESDVENEEDRKYEVMTKYNNQGFEGLLNVYSAAPEDAGIYSCETVQKHSSLEDCVLNKELNITVTVSHKPIFDEETENVYAKYNESADLVCAASGYPAPQYRWFQSLSDNSYIELPKQRIKFTENKTVATITLVGNSLTFGQTYICKAINYYGDSNKHFVLKKLEKPLKPSDVVVVNATDTQVDLNITWSEPVSFPISGFLVSKMLKGEKKRVTKESDWKTSDVVLIKVEEEATEEGTIITVEGLEPESDYWVRVTAMNSLGNSPWSSPILVSTQEAGYELDADVDDNSTMKNADFIEEPSNDTMFYGIFFAGGILVVAFACMVMMRLV